MTCGEIRSIPQPGWRSYGAANSVNLSKAAWERVAHDCTGESLGMVEVKGKGELEIIRFKAFIES